MNAPLRRVAVAVMVMFGLLLLNVNYLQAIRADDLRNNANNARVLIGQYERERGPIVVGGEQIARSVATDDALKYLRQYPGGADYAHVSGFYSLVYGGSAVEKAENDILAGNNLGVVTSQLTTFLTGGEVQGGSVVLTLDPAAQAAAVQGLNGKRGAVVAIEPATGRILAMASSPSYDPALLSSHDPAAIRAEYNRLVADPAEPLLNRAVARRYPPGSIFKVVTLAAALSSGNYTLATSVPAPDELTLPLTTTTLRNFGGESCGDGVSTTLLEALRISCNTAFAQLGITLGADKLREQATAFGVGSALSVPFDVARSVFPNSPNAPQTAQSAIGQFDVALTPLQAAMIAAGIANNGEVMKPYLVQEVQGPDLQTLRRTTPEVLTRATTAEVAAQVRTAMEAVVASGSGTRAQIDGVRVAGKTGTAQNAPGKAPHAWFISFAPAQDPRVAVAVIVENGGTAGNEATGGAVAAPIARAVMQAVLARSPR